MLSFIRNKTFSKKTWIENYDERFFAIKFSSIADPLNPHSLWSYNTGSDKNMVEEHTGSVKNRLRDALENHRRSVYIINSKGWKEKRFRVFTDVVIRISLKVWDKYAQIGGSEIQYFSETLEKLHEKDFGDKLWIDRKPTYVIKPEPTLKPDEIVVQIGMGVFVPAEEDEPIGKIQIKLSNEKIWYDLPDWSIWQEEKITKKPAGLYKNQQFIVLGPDLLSSSVDVINPNNNKPVWFDHGKGRIFLNLYSDDSLSAYGDNIYISHGRLKAVKDNHETICEFDNKTNESSSAIKLLLKITPFSHPVVQKKLEPVKDSDDNIHDNDVMSDAPDQEYTQSSENDSRQTATAEEDMSFRTYIPKYEEESGSSYTDGATYIPKEDYHRLVLTGFALPKINTPYGKSPDLKQWKIWFDEEAFLVNNDATDPENKAAIELSAVHNASFLFYRKNNENTYHEIKTLPQKLTISEDYSTEIVPLPLSDAYFGMMYYPQYDEFELSETEMTIGRSNGSSGEQKPDINLDFLNHPKSLSWDEKLNRNAPLNVHRLSRLHLKLKINNTKLHIAFHKKGSAPVFSLDKDLNLIKRLSPQKSDTIQLSSGEHLLIGCYVLCYQSPEE